MTPLRIGILDFSNVNRFATVSIRSENGILTKSFNSIRRLTQAVKALDYKSMVYKVENCQLFFEYFL